MVVVATASEPNVGLWKVVFLPKITRGGVFAENRNTNNALMANKDKNRLKYIRGVVAICPTGFFVWRRFVDGGIFFLL
jgi:hypothetical protein